jgi:hypothetical protein
MNIIQLHQKVKFIIDHKFSPRFRLSDYDDAINTCIGQIVKDRIGNIKQPGKPYSLQSSELLRDELYTLVKNSSPLAVNGNKVPITIGGNQNYPADFYTLINLKVNISGQEYVCYPTTYHEADTNRKDPFKRATTNYPDKVYNIEDATGQTIDWGLKGTLISASMQYLSQPVKVNSGIVIKIGDLLPLGTQVISTSDATKYDGITYKTGVLFTFTNATIGLSSGSAVYNWVDHNLAVTLEEEVAMAAASLLSKTTEDWNKGKVFDNEVAKV